MWMMTVCSDVVEEGALANKLAGEDIVPTNILICLAPREKQ